MVGKAFSAHVVRRGNTHRRRREHEVLEATRERYGFDFESLPMEMICAIAS